MLQIKWISISMFKNLYNLIIFFFSKMYDIVLFDTLILTIKNLLILFSINLVWYNSNFYAHTILKEILFLSIQVECKLYHHPI